MSEKIWQTARRVLDYEKPLIMGILNVTPDSFSDGGRYNTVDLALKKAEQMIADGADILDIGGESTRPQSARVLEDEEIRRVVPVINAIANRFSIPLSIDTSKSGVALEGINAGAEIINDVSGLTFDKKIADVAAKTQAGLVLMHLRGSFETMHSEPPVEQILPEVVESFRRSIEKAIDFGVNHKQIALDIGIGFSKTFSQNLELLARLDEICHCFAAYAILVGTSRKSFIGKILDGAPPEDRLFGSLASNAVAVFNGANIIRVHDVKAAAETAKVAAAIRKLKDGQDEQDKS